MSEDRVTTDNCASQPETIEPAPLSHELKVAVREELLRLVREDPQTRAALAALLRQASQRGSL